MVSNSLYSLKTDHEKVNRERAWSIGANDTH